MESRFTRTERVYGPDAVKKLAGSRVAVFGLGGVGGYALEALARSGIGALDLVDHDVVSLSNFNRQILATGRTLGSFKADAAKERVYDINTPPCCAFPISMKPRSAPWHASCERNAAAAASTG